MGLAAHTEGFPEQAKPFSTWQDDEQPSPLFLFLSSQPSPDWITPSPHVLLTINVHTEGADLHVYPLSTWHCEHPSPTLLFPSSHFSELSITPFPHKETHWPLTGARAGLTQVKQKLAEPLHVLQSP